MAKKSAKQISEDEDKPFEIGRTEENEPGGDGGAHDGVEDINWDDDNENAPPKPKKLADEPLFAALLRRAVKAGWGDDETLLAFCDCVAAPLSAQLGHVGAKGGHFAAQKMQAGQDAERYKYDQSLRAHLINGLFPVLRISRKLKAWGAPQFRRYDPRAERLFIAGFLLHDWVKLPGGQRALTAEGLTHGTVNAAKDLPFMRKTFASLCRELGIDAFLEPLGGVDVFLDDLIAIASNTQVRWGTTRNVSAFPNLALDGPTRDLCEQLSRMADYITYLARTPRDVVSHGPIRQMLMQLSDGRAKLVCHHVADVRGILTNLIHNAAMHAMTSDTREPLLFAASGVVYLEREGAPPLPTPEKIADDTIETIKTRVSVELVKHGKGMTRGPIGVKVAEYYRELFDGAVFGRIAADIIPEKVIPPSKKPLAEERYAKITASGRLAPEWTNDLPVDIQVDQLAEWCQVCDVALRDAGEDISDNLLDALALGKEIRAPFEAVPRENRITGGLGLCWFFAAGQYRKRHPGLDPEAWRERMAGIADTLAKAIGPVPLTQEDPWRDTHDYIARTLIFAGGAGAGVRVEQSMFLRELGNYANAKRSGRGVSIASSVNSSPYESREQREPSVLFAPQVYSSKLPLHGSKAIRGIDPISAKEMMLRQLFMNRSNAIGGKFEGQKIRYLYFYPMYFFSPETMKVFEDLYDRLMSISLTELKRQLVDETAAPPTLKLDEGTLQRLEEMMLTVNPPSVGEDRLVRMRFSDDMPITFYFLGLPSGREPTDTESWVRPALLALLLPLCLDVKVVASESPIPLLNEGDEISETTILDSPHAFVQHLLGDDRINMDEVLPKLRKLLTAYFIHLDGNSKQGAAGFDYNWARLPTLARDLSQSAAYACHYAQKWVRKQKNMDSLPENKARLYIQYTRELEKDGGKIMAIATELVTRYRGFYRAKRYNSNSILRPISEASKAVLGAKKAAHPDTESLVLAVRGQLYDFVERVSKGAADGYLPKGISSQDREAAMQDFAEYFVRYVFLDVFRGDRAALRGKQLNLIKSACEVVYRDLQTQEKAARGKDSNAPEDEESGEDSE